ncbi:hypothetical protein E0Z10_g3081 [Xylaria hypoxylon]|uniref:Uncharacterized protein n=1 Tax=Xylaria hypoxylon TaxID=37992 RepID=A0A4Z0YP53_9PEZI|nr:hypothetical protein E0Z10_g3081 [Xylaria hypoxylon]
MMSRSGLSIRKLIPNRRLSDEDLGGAELKKENGLPVSWTDQDSAGSLYDHEPSNPFRYLKATTAASERDTTFLSKFIVYITDPDDTLTHHIPKSRFNSFNDSTSKEDVTRSLSPEGKDREVTLKDRQSEGNPSRELSNDARQFMQETEDAFKAIGSTFSEVHVSPPTVFETTKTSSLDIPRVIESPPPTPPPKEMPLSLSKSPSARAPSMFSSPLRSSPKDNSPPQIPKRKKSKKSKKTRSMRQTRKPTAPKQAVRSGPRWTLTENVSELLTGKLFHKIEADEMLTSDQIEAFKQQRITKLQVEKMAEALEHEIADIPMEHFQLDDLPLRGGSAGIGTDIETLAEEKHVISFSEDMVQRNFFERQDQNSPPSIPPRRRLIFHKINTPPIISSRHVRSSSRRIMTELPIIPETSITPRKSDDLYFSNESNDSLGNTSTSEYVYLKSPQYSLHTPCFQHGPIRLSKSDLLPDMTIGHDNALDWTAFQIAILGGAGHLFSDNNDAQRRIDAEEIADINEWWDSWHFDSTGGLVTHDYEASSPTSTLSGDEIPDLAYSEIESDNSQSPQRGWQDAQRKPVTSGLQLDLGFTKAKKRMSSDYFADRLGNTGDAMHQDSEQKQVVDNRESINSLPPSPMLDLRVIRSDNGDDLDVVPMGYNLGHDLGDFLKWEAEHAFAGDFNSP